MRGVHPTIESLFFPQYSYEAARFDSRSASTKNKKCIANVGSGPKRATRYRPGTHAGLLVDREVTRTVKLLQKYHMPMQVFSSSSVSARKAYIEDRRDEISEADQKEMNKKQSTATTLIWQTLYRLKLLPVDTQIKVGCQSLRLGTAVDLRCIDPDGKYVLVEIKTGFTNYYHKHTKYPLQVIEPSQTDTPCHQFQLQLALTYELYRRTFPSHPISNALVLRVDGFGVELTPMQNWVKTNLGRIVNAVKGPPTAPVSATLQQPHAENKR